MGTFQSNPVAIGTSNTEVYLMSAGRAGAALLGVGNQTGSAITYTVKIFKQATGLTTTIVTSQSAPANKFEPFGMPIMLEAGDKIIMTAPTTGIVAVANVTDTASAPAAKGYTPRGNYSDIATYNINDVVTASDGGSYISMEDDNIGNDPTSSPMSWMVNAEKGETGEAGDTAMSIVRAVATTNITIASALENGDTLDGVTLATGDLVLLTGQTAPAENGVYLVQASGAAARASGFAAYDSYPGRYFSVMEGTAGADKLYRCTSNKGGTLGTTAIVVSEFTSGGGGTIPKTLQARLTLLSGTSETSSDIAGAGTIYCTPHKGNVISRYDGVKWSNDEFSEITLALDSNSGHTGYHATDTNFDAFYFDDAGTKRAGTGPGWTGLNTRGTDAGTTEVEFFEGVWVNKNSIVLRFGTASGNTVTVPARQATLVGSFRTVANGQTSDTKAIRYVSNVTDEPRPLYTIDAAGTWNYSVQAYREINGNSANRLQMFCCLPKSAWARYMPDAVNSAATYRYVTVQIGIDDSLAGSATQAKVASVYQSVHASPEAYWEGYLSAGYHYLAALECGNNADTQTWSVVGVLGNEAAPFIGGVRG